MAAARSLWWYRRQLRDGQGLIDPAPREYYTNLPTKENNVPSKSEHRASIRGAVISAALDLGNYQWGEDNDRLLDLIDGWLDSKERSRANVTAVGNALLSEQQQQDNDR